MNDVMKFITLLRESDRFIKQIYSQGSCYQFYRILKYLFPKAKPYVVGFYNHQLNKEVMEHIVTEIDSVLYDINGVFNIKDFDRTRKFTFMRALEKKDLEEVEKWSFGERHYIPDCEECELAIK